MVSGILSRGKGQKVDAYHFKSPRRRRDDVDICCLGGGSGGSVKVKSNVWHVFGDGETRWWGTLAYTLYTHDSSSHSFAFTSLRQHHHTRRNENQDS